MLINDIVSGISQKLHETFGGGFEIYKEQVKQGLNPPCFKISCVNSTVSHITGDRYHMANLFSVVYFPKNALALEAECRDMQVTLFDKLEYVFVDGCPIRGTGMGGQLVDGSLVFTVNYNLFVKKIDKEQREPMETLVQINIEAKG